MSRIEMAMELAARVREGHPEIDAAAVPPAAPRRALAPVPPAPLPPHEALNPRNPFLVTLREPFSAAAEEYRKLKSALVKLTQGELFRNVVMVSSSIPGEGKSLTALNLAISIAQGLDHTVLLIDADLRRPSLHGYLEMEEGPGISDVLNGAADLAATIIPTGIGKLSVLRAGSRVENPVELFSSQKMKLLVEELKTRYPDRYVILDTPPLLPFAESRALASLVDGVLFVVMERLATQDEIREGLDALRGSRLLGMVYNGAAAPGSDRRYGYYRQHSQRS